MTQRYLCVHAHFYQPPREDPRTGQIPIEPGAAPYPNWNERIYHECYRPNAELNNYERISYDVGPTLFEWLAAEHPDTLAEIVNADRRLVTRFGSGNAMAMPYHHPILPLASYLDKITQVRWGILDFEARFGRKPTGMWLPETAVDDETLIVLADHGIRFTILAPWQARAKHLDVTQPYRVELPQGKSMIVFFYHAPLSGGISFHPPMTINADQFVTENLLPVYQQEGAKRAEAKLILLASDGELYGHHQPLRQYFLERLLTESCRMNQIGVTYPEKWLQDYAVRRTVHIRQRTSWSCHHGVARWSTGCACTPGDSSWKNALRSALNQIAAEIDQVYEDTASKLVEDVWEMRHNYLKVLLGQVSLEAYLRQMAGKSLSVSEHQTLLQLLEAQFERHRMFASCGWFFEDFDRIEPRNAIAYAAHAVRLTELAGGVDLSAFAKQRLKKVVSPTSGLRGDQVFEQYRDTAFLTASY
ncbi:MAG: glycoside hydrolase [Anaerolineae bacterium]|jgi:alpha-amylase/alpha-mannosidase (GH57 family)|nr:MAG: glycoside hydrolase [Anaerolineae bacterium]